MSDFRSALNTFQQTLQTTQHERGAAIRTTTQPAKPAAMSDFPKSKGVTALMQGLLKLVDDDIYQYTISNSSSDESNTPEEAENPVADKDYEDDDASAVLEKALAENSFLPPSTYTNHFIELLRPHFAPVDDSSLGALISKPNRRLYTLLQTEINRMNENLGRYGSNGVNSLQKLRKSEEYIKEGNISGALRLIKAAKTSDPHNSTLSFVLSQILYYQAQQGQNNALPEARNEASKACLGSEQVDSSTLQLYRYYTVCCERPFSDKRAMEWIQDFYLLDPEQTSGSGGLSRNRGLHLKAWLLVSTIPAKLWGDYVFQSLEGIVKDTIGGVTLYIHCLRSRALTEAKSRSIPPKGILELEQMIAKSFANYSRIMGNYKKGWNEGPSVQNHWAVRNRFVSDFFLAAPIPSYDEIMLNVALNGRTYELHAYPVNEYIEKGYSRENYWRIWAINTVAAGNEPVRHILPVGELAEERKFYHAADELLQTLVQAEEGLIESETWEKLEPHMTKLTLDHIVDAANQGHRSGFSPNTPPFNSYHREWAAQLGANIRPSYVINTCASYGGFASIEEIYAAFAGALTMINDETYGIKAQQRAAKKIHDRKSRRKSSGFNLDISVLDDPQVQTALYIFIPVAVLSFIFAFFLLR